LALLDQKKAVTHPSETYIHAEGAAKPLIFLALVAQRDAGWP